VSGDYPSGCSGAEFGDGYYDVVGAFFGSFLSICSTDWGVQLDALARDSIASNIFTLSDPAIEESIDVYIDGILVADWTFEESTNSVIINTAVASNSHIVIDYASWGCL